MWIHNPELGVFLLEHGLYMDSHLALKKRFSLNFIFPIICMYLINNSFAFNAHATLHFHI